jgi:hypothetical protein
MIFAHKKYKKYKPRIYSNWIKAVNKESNYLKSIDNPMEYLGKCKAIELSSEHPYWQQVSYQQTKKYIKSVKKEIEDNKQLLKINPNHYHKDNILRNIARLESILNKQY